MKKFLLSLIALFGVVSANAQTTADVSSYTESVAYVEGATYYAGSSQIDLTILIKQLNDIAAAQFNLTLPEGLSFVADESATDDITPLGTTDEQHTFMGKIESATEAHIVLFSGKQIAFGDVVATVRVAVDNSVIVAGTEYNVTISAQNLGNGSGKEIFQNVPLTSTIIFENQLVFDETKSLPKFINGQSVNAHVIRTLKANQWSTLVLPFTMTQAKANAAFGSDASYATFSGWTIEVDEETGAPTKIVINFTKKNLGQYNQLTAGTPILIKTTGDVESFDVEAVKPSLTSPSTISKNPMIGGEPVEVFNGNFIGTFEPQIIPQYGLFISGNKFYYSKGNTSTKGYRGYFMLDAILDQPLVAPEVKFSVLVDGEETTIDNIRIVDTKGAVYTLDGKFVGRDVDLKKLQKGIYIIDGKKVAVK